jgi:hypothetical protein
MELFGFGGGFYRNILSVLPSAGASFRLNEIFHVQGHPYTLAVPVRAERSLGRCSRKRPNNLILDQSIGMGHIGNSRRTQHSRHRSETRIDLLLVGSFDF